MKLYLAGPMTGYDRWNYDAFLAGAEKLRAAGFDVVSPAEIELEAGFDPDTAQETYTAADYHAAMRRDIQLVLDVDGVALLPGWNRSKGATAEAAVAMAIGIPALVLDQWVLRAASLALATPAADVEDVVA